MNKIWLLLIIGLLLSACTSSQTEAPPTLTPLPPTLTDTPLPPTETSVPPTPTPNPHAEDAIVAWCESLIEEDVDKALSLFTEEIKIYTDWVYEGLSGVESFVTSRGIDFSCEVKGIEVTGNDVEVQWNASYIDRAPPAPDALWKLKCTIHASMKEEKIDLLRYDCTGTLHDMD